MTQVTLWLLPLVVGSIFGIANALKAGIRWSWGVIIQHCIVMIIALLGLSVLSKWDWLCAYIGWGYLLGFTVFARVVLMKMTQALGLLRCEQAIKQARILRFVLWGPPGKFWVDLTYMINFAVQGDTKSANAIFEKWRRFGLPKSVADSLSAYAMIAHLVVRDWEATVQKYNETKARYQKEIASKKKEVRFPFQIAVTAVRAFNELGRYREAAEALQMADLPSSNYGRDSLETIFLSYFALLGASQDLNNVLESMSKSKTALPEHARLFWQARCAAEQGDLEGAIRIFAESLRKTPEKDTAWRERTQYQMKLCQERLLSEQISYPSVEQERLAAATVGREILSKCLVISEIMNSRRAPMAVRVLTGVISIVFICCFSPYYFGDKSYLEISNFAFTYGVLSSEIFKGEWWRLVSYLFLHGGLSHLFMNLFGLVWFGRFVENIFGTANFLIIFLGSGILSGLTQVLMDPSGQAVGASGAVLGVFGAGLAAMLRLKNVVPRQIRNNELSWMLALAVTQLLFDQIVNFLFPAREGAHEAIRIAAAAHFGGMVSGFGFGCLLPMKKVGSQAFARLKLNKPDSSGAL